MHNEKYKVQHTFADSKRASPHPAINSLARSLPHVGRVLKLGDTPAREALTASLELIRFMS